MTGLELAGAAIVLARRCGTPNVHYMNREELEAAENSFKNRAIQYFETIHSQAIQEVV